VQHGIAPVDQLKLCSIRAILTSQNSIDTKQNLMKRSPPTLIRAAYYCINIGSAARKSRTNCTVLPPPSSNQPPPNSQLSKNLTFLQKHEDFAAKTLLFRKMTFLFFFRASQSEDMGLFLQR